jgi:hypothetical protein
MNIERLLRLADYLETVNPETFNMRTWGSRNECGTTACAMGHACDIPEFKELGLKLVWPELDHHTAQIEFPCPRRNITRVGIGAAQAFFDLDSEQACFLFAGQTDAGFNREDETPLQVVARLRTFVEKDGEIEDDYYPQDFWDYDEGDSDDGGEL